MSNISDQDAVRLAAVLTDKHLDAPGQTVAPDDIARIVQTTVADVLLVAEGTLAIEDYETDGKLRRSFCGPAPTPVGDLTTEQLRERLDQLPHDEPPPAELIPDLDWIEVCGAFGIPLSEKKQERARAKMAADHTARGEPFIYKGVRHGPPA